MVGGLPFGHLLDFARLSRCGTYRCRCGRRWRRRGRWKCRRRRFRHRPAIAAALLTHRVDLLFGSPLAPLRLIISVLLFLFAQGGTATRGIRLCIRCRRGSGSGDRATRGGRLLLYFDSAGCGCLGGFFDNAGDLGRRRFRHHGCCFCSIPRVRRGCSGRRICGFNSRTVGGNFTPGWDRVGSRAQLPAQADCQNQCRGHAKHRRPAVAAFARAP